MTTGGGFVYLDASAALAHLLSETIAPPEEMWSEVLVSSRLLEYEIRTRLHAMGLSDSHGPLAEDLLAHVSLVEIVRPVIGRIGEGWPSPVRTLDALHLASMVFLREQGAVARLASYDRRLNAAAEALGFGLYPL
jgi:uncharacterized protein